MAVRCTPECFVPRGLPAELYLRWEHQYTARERVWNDPLNWDVMRYDRNFEPIVVGNTMFLAFSDSDTVVSLDTDTGKEKWRFCAGGPVRLPPAVWNETLYATSDDGYLYCLIARDINTGNVLWGTHDCVFGSYLSLSEEYGMLLESTRASRDTVRGESGTRMVTYNARNGEVLWNESAEYKAFPILHHDTIICGAESWKPEKRAQHFNLLTGVRLTRESPITCSEVELTWACGYGCNHPLASEHMVFFRSGAAGHFDHNQNSGTGNFGGFKSGCTESLVAADGVLNAPDYTRTCICTYQNQLSLALVHMPENEAWTFNELNMDNASIESIGLNLGAPGDRVSENDTWWFEYPVVGRPSPTIHAEITGEAEYFTHHSSRFEGEIPWVVAS